MGPCEVGADRQTVRGGKGVYNSGARRITVFCWSSETSAIKTQTPGNYPKRNILQLKDGESLKIRLMSNCVTQLILGKPVTTWRLCHLFRDRDGS